MWNLRHFSLKACAFLNAAPALLLAAAGLGASAARADPSVVDALNEARARGCEGRPGLMQPLRHEPRLDRAAESSPPDKGHSVDVLAGYRALRWSVLRIGGPFQPHAIAAAVAKASCSRLLDAEFTAAGAYRSGSRTVLVLAVPFAVPQPGAEAAIARRVLDLVNQARAQPRQCGDKAMPAAGPVRHNAVLEGVAADYSAEMARHGDMAHRGRDGSMVNDRVNRTAYRWRALGENLASGMNTPEAAVAGWLKSPGHCATLMDAQYRDMGVAYAYDERSKAGMYWTQLFARPR